MLADGRQYQRPTLMNQEQVYMTFLHSRHDPLKRSLHDARPRPLLT